LLAQRPDLNLAHREWVRVSRYPRYWGPGIPGLVIAAAGFGLLHRYPEICLVAIIPYGVGYLAFATSSCFVGNEKDCHWLTGALPLGGGDVIRGKFFALSAAGLCGGAVAISVGWVMTTLSPWILVSSGATLVSLVTTAVAFGLRAAASGPNFFPRERDVDPEALAVWLLAWHGLLAVVGSVAGAVTGVRSLPLAVEGPGAVAASAILVLSTVPALLRGAASQL